MYKFNIIFLILFIFNVSKADDFENYLSYRAGLSEYKGDVKCATKYETQLRILLNSSNSYTNSKLNKIQLAEPDRTDSLVTQHFTLHWNESGSHSVPLDDISSNGIPDYIDSAATILEHVWDVEINQMNYTPPPQQNGLPVNTYHVYFTDMSYYGVTYGSGIDIPSLPGTNWTSYLELENDYQESFFYSQGLDGLRVTAAHEFHHAIQFGYNVRQDDFFFYEMTSTWMEDYLYTEINDYYDYLPTLFNSIGNRSFDDYSLYAYGNCLYVHMIVNQFGEEIVKQIWDEIKLRTAINAISNVLKNPPYSSTWLNSLAEYGIWLYYTGNRANPIDFFPEGEYYPQYEINPGFTYQFTDSIEIENTLYQNSFRYYKLNEVKDKALLSILTSDNAVLAGQQLITSTNTSDFSEIGITLNNFVVNEDSVIAIITNAENYNNDLKLNIKLLTNFVKIDSLIIQALPGRNMLTWSSSYESLLKEYKLRRQIQDGDFQIIYVIEGNEYSTTKNDYVFIDENIEVGINYSYRLDVEYFNGETNELDLKSVNSLEPAKFELLQNYPNPFNNETSIIVEIINNTQFELYIYNTLGQKVKTLQKKQTKLTGFYSYKWIGDGDSGQRVASGVYFAILAANNKTQNVKIVLIK